MNTALINQQSIIHFTPRRASLVYLFLCSA
jgi:hypothetical protein